MQEERYMAENEIDNARRPAGDTEVLLAHDLRTKPPFVVTVEEKCEECGGSGYDWGSLNLIDPEECPGCQGSGKQIVVHNYLAEALRIAAGKSSRPAQREHLDAVIQHCRSLVAAVMAIADIQYQVSNESRAAHDKSHLR